MLKNLRISPADPLFAAQSGPNHRCAPAPCAAGPDLSGLIAQAESFYKVAKAPATIKAFELDIASFGAFTTRKNLAYLLTNVEAVVLYVSSFAAANPPMSYATIRRRLSAISFAHRLRGLESPATPQSHFVFREVQRRREESGSKKPLPRLAPRPTGQRLL
jgi:hypothetical protein